jgi:hypothetical protein
MFVSVKLGKDIQGLRGDIPTRVEITMNTIHGDLETCNEIVREIEAAMARVSARYKVRDE